MRQRSAAVTAARSSPAGPDASGRMPRIRDTHVKGVLNVDAKAGQGGGGGGVNRPRGALPPARLPSRSCRPAGCPCGACRALSRPSSRSRGSWQSQAGRGTHRSSLAPPARPAQPRRAAGGGGSGAGRALCYRGDGGGRRGGAGQEPPAMGCRAAVSGIRAERAAGRGSCGGERSG